MKKYKIKEESFVSSLTGDIVKRYQVKVRFMFIYFNVGHYFDKKEEAIKFVENKKELENKKT